MALTTGEKWGWGIGGTILAALAAWGIYVLGTRMGWWSPSASVERKNDAAAICFNVCINRPNGNSLACNDLCKGLKGGSRQQNPPSPCDKLLTSCGDNLDCLEHYFKVCGGGARNIVPQILVTPTITPGRVGTGGGNVGAIG